MRPVLSLNWIFTFYLYINLDLDALNDHYDPKLYPHIIIQSRYKTEKEQEKKRRQKGEGTRIFTVQNISFYTGEYIRYVA